MRAVFLSCLLLPLIVGCASVKGSKTLYGAYSDYVSIADRNNIIDVADDFFSRNLLGEGYRSNPDAANQLLFKNYMSNTHSHFESIENDVGCLIVNGTTAEGEPVVFSLKYSAGSTGWLIDGIHVGFVETVSAYPKIASCPADYFG